MMKSVDRINSNQRIYLARDAGERSMPAGEQKGIPPCQTAIQLRGR